MSLPFTSQKTSVSQGSAISAHLPIVPIDFAWKIPLYGTEGLEVEMAGIEIQRRNSALEQTIILKPNDPYFPTITFKVSEFVEGLQKIFSLYFKNPSKCWLKGSWTNPKETNPRDVDIATCVQDPYWEVPIYTALVDFLKTKIPGAKETYWLPLSAYFDAIPVKEIGARSISFKVYRGSGIDFTVYYKPIRYSVGISDGQWFSCNHSVKRLSRGRRFEDKPDGFTKAEYYIKHHLNDIEEPETVYNLQLRVLLEMTRKAVILKPEIFHLIKKGIYKETHVDAFSKRWFSHQNDHYEHDGSKVIDFLNLLCIHAHNPYGASFIAKSWLNVSQKQNIPGMKSLCEIIIHFPEIAPHLIAFIQGLLILQGNKTYKFGFNEPTQPIRPYMALKVKNQINYLALPVTQNSPIHLAQNLINSLPKLLDFAKASSHLGKFKNLDFLTELFNHFGLNTKYIGEMGQEHILEDFHRFFSSKEAHELQALFGPYPQAKDYLTKLQPLKKATVVDSSPIKTPTPKLELESKRSSPKKEEIVQPAPPSVENETDRDLREFEAVSIKYQLDDLKLGISLIKRIFNSDIKQEKNTKELPDLLYKLLNNYKEIASNQEIEKAIGTQPYKDYFAKILPLIFEKGLLHPTPEIFNQAYQLFIHVNEDKNLSEAQKHLLISSLINAWYALSPLVGSDLHTKGCDLICQAFQENIIGQKDIYTKAFDGLVTSNNPAHLRVGHSLINLLIMDQDPDVLKRMITLMSNTLLNNFKDLYRPLFKTLVNLYKRNHAAFEQLMREVGPLFSAIILNGMQQLIPLLKYNGDEVLLFNTLCCILDTYPSPTALKLALSIFDELMQKKELFEIRNPNSLKRLEREGLIARKLLQLGAPFKNSPLLAWENESMRNRWFKIAAQLRSVSQEQAESLDGSMFNRYRELGLELLHIFLASSPEEEWQNKINELIPKMVDHKKTETSKENSIDKVNKTVQKILNVYIVNKKENRLDKISALSEKLLKEIQASRPEELTKDCHANFVDGIAKVQYHLSCETDLPLAHLLYNIFLAALEKNYTRKDNPAYAYWVIRTYLLATIQTQKNENDIKLPTKLLPLFDPIINSFRDLKLVSAYNLILVIDSLGLIIRDSASEKHIIAEYFCHLLKHCEQTTDIQIYKLITKHACDLIQDLLKESNSKSFSLALKLLMGMIKINPNETPDPRIIKTLNDTMITLPKEWRGEECFKQIQSFVDFLCQNDNYLGKLDENIQHTVISAVHRTQSSNRDYIWKLLLHVGNAKSYDHLLKYLRSVLKYPAISKTNASLLSVHYKNGMHIWEKTNKLQEARSLLIHTYLATGHPVYIKEAVTTFNLPDFEPSPEISMQLLNYLSEADLKTFSFQLVPIFKKVCKSCLQLGTQETANDANTKMIAIIQRLLQDPDSKKYGTEIFFELIGSNKIGNKIINPPEFLDILKLHLYEVRKKPLEIYSLIEKTVCTLSTQNKESLNNYTIPIFDSIEKTLLANAKKPNDELLNFLMTDFIPTISRIYPEKGRKILPLILIEILKNDKNLNQFMLQMTKKMDEFQLYNLVTEGPFITRKPTDEEQRNINKERLFLENTLFYSRLGCQAINSKDEFIDEDVHERLIEMTRWVVFDSPEQVYIISQIHSDYTKYIMRKALLQNTDKELSDYAYLLSKLLDKLLNQVSQIKKAGQSEQAILYTIPPRIFIDSIPLIIKKAILWPYLFIQIYKSLPKNIEFEQGQNYLRSKFLGSEPDQLKALETLKPLKAFFSSEPALKCGFPLSRIPDSLEAIEGLCLSNRPIHYKNAMSDSAKIVLNNFIIKLVPIYLNSNRILIKLQNNPTVTAKECDAMTHLIDVVTHNRKGLAQKHSVKQEEWDLFMGACQNFCDSEKLDFKPKKNILLGIQKQEKPESKAKKKKR